MKILIDARMYGLEHAGIGRYILNLVKKLSQIDKENHYLILLKEPYFSNLHLPQSWQKRLVDISHYSLAEQFMVLSLLNKEKPDLVHFPHFNVPIFYFGKFVVTIHDLIKHSWRGLETTTKSPWLYWFKYLGYQIVFFLSVKMAKKIFVPSEKIKDDLVKTYHLPQEKIVVTNEGVDDKFQVGLAKEKVLARYKIKEPFVIYTGSLYPHKNVERLVKAVDCFNDLPRRKAGLNHSNRILSLVIVCSRSVFYQRFREKIKEMKAGDFVHFLGFVGDEDLAALYQKAVAFVFPTFEEGFGLPGLEAMACGCPVLCSDIPVLHEIYGDAAIYFAPLSVDEMAGRIEEVVNLGSEEKEKWKDLGFKQAKKYSWVKMAKETKTVYESLRN